MNNNDYHRFQVVIIPNDKTVEYLTTRERFYTVVHENVTLFMLQIRPIFIIINIYIDEDILNHTNFPTSSE